MKYSLISLFVIALAWPAFVPPAQADEINVDSLIAEIDSLYRSKTSYSEIEMTIITPRWERVLSLKAWSEGLEKTLIRITDPRREKGVGTLRTGDDMWNYLPRTNKVIKIPPSMMMSSWMGSDFNNDDLVKEFSLYEDYSYELIEPEDAVDSLIYVNCIPREDLPVVWGNVVIAAGRDNHLPVWQKYYDEQGEMLREMHYSDVTTFGDRTIPATMEMIPHTKEGHRTIIHYQKLEFDIELDRMFFSQRTLRSPEI